MLALFRSVNRMSIHEEKRKRKIIGKEDEERHLSESNNNLHGDGRETLIFNAHVDFIIWHDNYLRKFSYIFVSSVNLESCGCISRWFHIGHTPLFRLICVCNRNRYRRRRRKHTAIYTFDIAVPQSKYGSKGSAVHHANFLAQNELCSLYLMPAQRSVRLFVCLCEIADRIICRFSWKSYVIVNRFYRSVFHVLLTTSFPHLPPPPTPLTNLHLGAKLPTRWIYDVHASEYDGWCVCGGIAGDGPDAFWSGNEEEISH